MLEITEIFYSLQGEGPHAGKPAVFVRLSGCVEPLCPWCDTMYACGKGKYTDLDDICAKIQSFHNDLVVITGGEPFLQWEKGLDTLEARLLERGYEVQYETGGKIMIPEMSRGFKVCSPKYIDGSWLFVEENIDRADVFKFVVSHDLDSVTAFVAKYKIPHDRVYIMPLGTTCEEQLVLLPSLWEFCAKNRYSFSPRLHTLAFDNKRGV